jgi:hypothetical protein
VVVESKTFTDFAAVARTAVAPINTGKGRNPSFDPEETWEGVEGRNRINGTDGRPTESVNTNRKYPLTPSHGLDEGPINARQITVHF